jgi:hypothetical protein
MTGDPASWSVVEWDRRKMDSRLAATMAAYEPNTIQLQEA